MRRLPPTRFIPQDAVPLTVDGADAIVYLYDHRGDQPCAIAYAGKANRPAWHRIYSSRDKAERLSREWLTGIAAAQVAEQQRRAELRAAKAQGHPYQIGDIFHHSWGWEQTNCDYYQVTAVTKGTVTIRKIAAKDANTDTGNSMACCLLPAPGRFLSDAEPIVKHPQTTDGKNWHIAMEYGWCDKWNGRPNYCSWYA